FDAPSEGSFRPDVQGLRAVAVALVIANHAGVPGFSGGYVGVDVFFVISGFVITGLLVRMPHDSIRSNLAEFYSRRIRRIVPAATLTLVVTVVAARALLGANFDPRLLVDARWAAFFAANWRFIEVSANYFIPGLAPSLVTHYWSLGVEEQFYLCYPVLLFGATWLAPARRRVAVLAGLLVAGVALSSWWSAHLTHVNATAAYYSPFTRFWELALGGLVAVVPAAWAQRTPRLNAALSVIAAVALGLAVWRLSATSAFPGVLAWWPCLAAAVLIHTGRSSLPGAPASWLGSRPFVYVGDLSYSLYLWHYAWLVLPAELVHPLTTPGDRVLEVAGAVACALLSFHFVENPLRRSRRLARDHVATFLLLACCVATVVVTTVVVGRLTPGS
ncbi:MAG TPA: acyltransferase, partial [Acidimicrobiales bacterium]|nr:acyltransferase [Acidimicrobiales bacterium]